MTRRTDRLLRDIEAGALDSSVPMADLLRKAVALGGRAGSTELQDWAARELKGYTPDDEIPEYRKIVAPLHMDLVNMRFHVTGHQVSPSELPDFAREKINNDLSLYMGIAEIEKLARQNSIEDNVVKLQPPLAPELVHYMNTKQMANGRIERLYWAVAPVALEGVADQVRTTLTVMVAEIHANIPEGIDTPPAEVATNAIHFAVTGRRNKVTFAAPQGGSTMTPVPADNHDDEQSRFGYWLKVAGAVVLGLVAIAAGFFTLMDVQNWKF